MFNKISEDNREGTRPVRYYMSIHVTHTHRTSKRSIFCNSIKKKKVRNKYNSSCYEFISLYWVGVFNVSFISSKFLQKKKKLLTTIVLKLSKSILLCVVHLPVILIFLLFLSVIQKLHRCCQGAHEHLRLQWGHWAWQGTPGGKGQCHVHPLHTFSAKPCLDRVPLTPSA